MIEFSSYNPKNYKILLEIDEEKSTFQGNVEIKIEPLKEIKDIILNIDDLTINSCHLIGNNENIDCNYTINKDKNELKIEFSKKVIEILKIKIEYEGKYHSDLLGMYRSQYEYENQKHCVIATQLEEAYARRVFPCIDHPSKKATFDIEFIIGEKMEAISNTSIIETISLDAHRKLIRFKKTPKMCTYLLFFAVGEFEILKNNDTKHLIRIVTTKGKTKYGNLAIEIAQKTLQYLEDTTSVDYPIDKCDLIAVPDFPFGAMENWGAISFRENLLLVIPNKTPKMGIFNIASVVAHEIAHFWFGNLVSPIDWKYIWLNESFASYFTYEIPHHYYPEWHSWEHFMIQYYITSLERDGLRNTFPVELTGNEESFITYDKIAIVYNKGAAILRMLVDYLGDINFKKGINHFMKTFQFANVKSSDYWESLEESTNQPVKEFADSWIYQSGYPLVSVKRKENSLEFNQQSFFYIPNEINTLYLIPINIMLYLNDGSTQKVSLICNKEFHKIEIPDNTQNFKLNFEQKGFYRVKYQLDDLAKMSGLINSKELSAIDRFGIENDFFSLIKAGIYHIDEYLNYLERFYIKEDDYLPLISIFSNLMYCYILLDKKRDKISKIGCMISKNFFNNYGFEPNDNEIFTVSISRSYLLWASFFLGYDEINDFAINKFKNLQNGINISGEIHSSILKIAAVICKESFSYFKEKMVLETTPEVEKVDIYSALGCFKDDIKIKEALELTLEKIPPQTWAAMFQNLARNPSAFNFLWPWFKENLEKIENMSPFILNRALATILPYCGTNYYSEVKDFLIDYKGSNKFQKDTIEMVLEMLEINMNFISNNNNDENKKLNKENIISTFQ